MKLTLFLTSLVIVGGVFLLLLYRHHLLNEVVKNSLRLTVKGCLREIKIKNIVAYRDDVKRGILINIIRFILFILFIIFYQILKNETQAYAYILLAPILLLGIKDLLDLISDIISLNNLKNE